MGIETSQGIIFLESPTFKPLHALKTFLGTVDQSSLLIDTSDPPTIEALVLTVYVVGASNSVFFAAFFSGARSSMGRLSGATEAEIPT